MNDSNYKTTIASKGQSNSLVVQGNQLVEAKYKLPLLAQQVLRVLVSKVNPDGSNIDKELYQINIAELGKMIGRSEAGNLKKETIRAAEVLRRTPIIIRKDDGGFLETSWIHTFRYYPREGKIDFAFSPTLNPFLIELRNRFTQYRLDNVCRLGSQYSIRIYELLRQYIKIGSRTIPLDELRAILGIGEGEYEDYRVFRIKILDVANKSINAKTDLKYSWEPVKEKKRVVAIRFFDIVLKEKEQPQTPPDTTSPPEIPPPPPSPPHFPPPFPPSPRPPTPPPPPSFKDDDPDFPHEEDSLSRRQPPRPDPPVNDDRPKEPAAASYKPAAEGVTLFRIVPVEHIMDKAFIDTLEHYVIQNGMDSVVAAVQYANKQNPKNYPAYVTTLLRNGFVPPKIETSYVNREVPSINREAPSASRLPSWLKPGVKILLNGKEVEVRSIIDDNISIERDDGIRLVIKEKHFLNALDDKRVSLVAGQLKMAQPVEEFDIDAFIEKLGQKVAANS